MNITATEELNSEDLARHARALRVAPDDAPGVKGTDGARVFTYVVPRDSGFAPNPFHGYCTLATGKADIRSRATIGDWVMGTAVPDNRFRWIRHVVFAMRVDEVLSFEEYFADPRFEAKKPHSTGNGIDRVGDNVYFREPNVKKWSQLFSTQFISTVRGNQRRLASDTNINRVLVSREFAYFGGTGGAVSNELDKSGNMTAFMDWYRSLAGHGYLGPPGDWLR